MIHKLTTEGKEQSIGLFTFPFAYIPHPLCVEAANQVKAYLKTQLRWSYEVSEGKMFGVLVVKDTNGEIGFLAAFSGQLGGSYLHDYFVPPIYDLNAPSSFFREEEHKIVNVNNQIDALVSSKEFEQAQSHLAIVEEQLRQTIATWNEKLKTSKEDRDFLRETLPPTFYHFEELERESQFLKAEAKRKKKEVENLVAEAKKKLDCLESQIAVLKEKRRRMSKDLQILLFNQFVIYNARKEKCSLNDLFAPKLPPSGAGECCAPKLLQYAYLNDLQPLCMAEFWMGKSPKDIVRVQGEFYPACIAKCKPILDFMLQGLNVEPNPLAIQSVDEKIDILYEDDSLLVVNKKSGMLSAPGLVGGRSVEEILQEQYPTNTIKVAHRLDMATSGILLVAKNEDVYANLQQQFANREVKKRYFAVLEGVVEQNWGEINLPLAPDWDNRPCQKVDYENGKPALTKYEVIEVANGKTKIWFYPQTGRTHQLRLHAAHPEGLNAPIVGDRLYGKPDERLCLVAQKITFHHPMSGKEMTFEVEARVDY